MRDLNYLNQRALRSGVEGNDYLALDWSPEAEPQAYRLRPACDEYPIAVDVSRRQVFVRFDEVNDVRPLGDVQNKHRHHAAVREARGGKVAARNHAHRSCLDVRGTALAPRPHLSLFEKVREKS
jgi:hypothetical protein